MAKRRPPIWSRDAIALAATLVAALPSLWWLVHLRFWASHDGTYHLYRVVELARLAPAGEVLPGWLPAFAAGYGYPLFSYYPPLAYVPAMLASFAGLDAIDAFKLSLALSVLTSAVGAYLLGRDLFASRLAGWLVAVAYLYAPYRFYDTFLRASPSGAWVFPFLPLLLWSIGRAAAGSRRHLALAALWLALLVLAHPVNALFFLPVALLWATGAVWRRPPAVRLDAAVRVAAALALGMIVSAGFWAPALAETGWVSTSNFNSPEYRPETHLTDLANVVDLQPVYDYTQPLLKYGFVQIVVALAGLAAWPWLGRRRAPIAAAALIVLAVALLLTPLLEPVWSLPLLASIQRPTRLLAIGALGTALLAGGTSAYGPAFRILGPVAALALIVSGVAWLQPFPLAPQGASLTLESHLRYEADNGVIGTTTAAEYVPVWARGGFIAPNEGFRRPGGTAADPPLEAEVLAVDAIGITLGVRAEQPTALRLHTFYFPGWAATVDGTAVAVAPSTALGLLTIEIPPGSHVVDVRFEPTLLRRVTALLAATGAFALLVLLLNWWRGAVAFVVGVALTVGGPALLRAHDAASWTPLEPANVSPAVDLAGGRWRSVSGGVEVELVWLAKQEGGPDERFGIRFVDAAGATIAERWTRPLLGASPVPAWSRNEVVRDPRTLLFPAGFVGGPVQLQLATTDGWRDIGGARPAGPGRPAPTPTKHSLQAIFGDRIALVGFDLNASGGRGQRISPPAGVETLLPGDQIDLRLVWEAQADIAESYTVFIHLIGPDGRRYDQRDRQPDYGFRSTVTWQRGVPVEDRYSLSLPPDAPSGAYRIEVGLYRTGDDERLTLNGTTASALVLGRTKVPAPPAPPHARELGRLGPIAIDASLANGDLELAWWALDVVGADYTVFLHAIDAEGRLVAQVDSPPLDGAYPTSLWSPGELIRETRPRLATPPGGRLVVGLYDPTTGERLRGPDGRDSIELPS